ncbi:helix-turn-helix transcriptional regulator [Streptomyces sp. NPDC005426]|uniref:helix-turn-helix domain-containing protein n=1 Tax=Streptomyces sp. NPDC005426 TaxID=3155344 RepID=UPI0033BB9A2D
MGTSGETTRGRRLVGELIRIHRVRAGLTQKEAAEQLLISESLTGAVERAERIPSRDLLIDADRVFGAGGALKACCELVDEEKYPPKFLDWAKLERNARVISAYETMLVPGLLQTEAYVHALYRSRVPAYTEDEIARHVGARLERQTVLSRTPPPRIGYVIEESVLDRTLGGPEVLKEQLRHVLDCVERFNHPWSCVGIPGFSRGETHPWPGGAQRRSSLRLGGDGQMGRFWPSMYCRITVSGAPPQEAAK